MKEGVFGIISGKSRYVKDGRGLFTAESSFGDKIKVWLPRNWDKHKSFFDLCDPVGKVIGIKYVEDEDDYVGKHFKVEVKEDGDYPIFLEKYNIEDFLKKSFLDIKEMKQIIGEFIERIENNKFKIFTKFIIDKHWESFSVAPAALGHHHNYFGGLLEHTIGVVRSILERVEFMKMKNIKINESLLISSGILHDIGKIQEYKFVNFAIEKNSNFHIISGPVILNLDYQEYVEKLNVEELLDLKDFEKIIQMISCHHGFKDWGSFVTPKDIENSLEGNILFRADFLDAGTGFV